MTDTNENVGRAVEKAAPWIARMMDFATGRPVEEATTEEIQAILFNLSMISGSLEAVLATRGGGIDMATTTERDNDGDQLGQG